MSNEIFKLVVNALESEIVELEVKYSKSLDKRKQIKYELEELLKHVHPLEKLNRDYQINESIYQNLVQKHEDSELFFAKKSTHEIIVVSPAIEPGRHVYPKRRLIMMSALMLNFLLSVLIFIFIDKLRKLRKVE